MLRQAPTILGNILISILTSTKSKNMMMITWNFSYHAREDQGNITTDTMICQQDGITEKTRSMFLWNIILFTGDIVLRWAFMMLTIESIWKELWCSPSFRRQKFEFISDHMKMMMPKINAISHPIRNSRHLYQKEMLMKLKKLSIKLSIVIPKIAMKNLVS